MVHQLWVARSVAYNAIHGSRAARAAVADREEMLVQHLRRGLLPAVRRELFFFGTSDGCVPVNSGWGRIQHEWARGLLARAAKM